MTKTQPRKEDVIRNLLESTKQPVDKKKESKGSVPTKKSRDLPPVDLGTPVHRESPTLEIKGDNRTIVDWMNAFGNGGFGEFACDSEPPSGSATPFVNTTMKLTCGQARVRRGVQEKGWTPPALRGKRSPACVDSGMEAMTTANAGEALSSWPSRNHTDG